jgi:hypothetical protein
MRTPRLFTSVLAWLLLVIVMNIMLLCLVTTTSSTTWIPVYLVTLLAVLFSCSSGVVAYIAQPRNQQASRLSLIVTLGTLLLSIIGIVISCMVYIYWPVH